MSKKNDVLTKMLDYGILMVLIILIIFFSVASSNFLSINTCMTILKQVSITGITSVGMCYVILTGGIDLSVGSIAAFLLSQVDENRGFVSDGTGKQHGAGIERN